MSKRDLAAFTRELSTLLEAGVSVVPALTLLREQRVGTAFDPIIESLVADLNAGLPLAEAMAKHPKVFARVFVWTVATSDRGAPIVGALQQAARFLETADSALTQAKRAMIYPMVVLVVGVGVTLMMITTALPPMIDLLSKLDSDLPLATRMLLGLSQFLAAYKVPLLLAFSALALGAIKFSRTPQGRMLIHRAVLHVPVVSTLVVQSDIARASGAMSLLTEAGLQLPEALEVARETVSNEVIRAALLQVQARLMAGEGFAAPLADTGLFPKTFTQSLRVAEDTGTLDVNLRRMAEFYERESTESVKALVAIIEPLSTIIVALMVGFIALAVITPMYSSLGALK